MPIHYLVKIIINCLIQSGPYIVLWVLGRSLYLRSHPTKVLAREKWLWLLVIYLILLIQITVFRFGIDWVSWSEPRVTNFTPITTLRYLKPWAVIYNVVGNISWFLPLGLLLSALWPKKRVLLPVLMAGIGLSATIEALQYLFNTGITDVDDLLFNALGTLIGWAVYRLMRWVRRHHKKSLPTLSQQADRGRQFPHL